MKKILLSIIFLLLCPYAFAQIGSGFDQGNAGPSGPGGSPTTPGGSGGSIQYNSGSAFAGVSNSSANSSGNVGLGTTNPRKKLHIAGTDPTILFQYTPASNYQWALRAVDNGFGNSTNFGLYDTTDGGATYNLDMMLWPSSTSSGIGIGTFNVDSRLVVQGHDNISTSVFRVKDLNATDLFTVYGNGNIGISTANPSQKLDINGLANAAGYHTNNPTGSWTSTAGMNIDPTGAGTLIHVGSDRNVGIGITNPGTALDVLGTVRMTSLNINSSEYWLKPTDSIVSALSNAASGDKIHLAANHLYQDTDCSMVINAKSLYLDFNGATVACTTNVNVLTISNLVSGTHFVYIKDAKIKVTVTANGTAEGIYLNQQSGNVTQYTDVVIDHPTITMSKTGGTSGTFYGILHEDASSSIINPVIDMGNAAATDIGINNFGIHWRYETTAEAASEARLYNPDIYVHMYCSTNCTSPNFERGIDFYKLAGSADAVDVLRVFGGHVRAEHDTGCKVTNNSSTVGDTNVTEEDLSGTICEGPTDDVRNASAFGAIARLKLNGTVLANGLYSDGIPPEVQEYDNGTIWSGGIWLDHGPKGIDNVGLGFDAPALLRASGAVGGAATGDHNTNQGGVGAAVSITAGNGGTSASATSTRIDIAGAGGPMTFTSGDGSAATGVGNNTGGAGGTIAVVAGKGGNSTNGLTNTGGAGGNITFQAGNVGVGTTANGALGYITMQSLYGGNVGIGTLVPKKTLDVQGTIRSGNGSVSAPSLMVGNDNTYKPGFYYSNVTAPAVNFSMNGVDLLSLSRGPSGDTPSVGIGTLSPSKRLEITGPANNLYFIPGVLLTDTANAASRRWFIGSGAYNYGDLNFEVSADKTSLPGSSDVKMTLRSDGNLGLGQLLPASLLTVNGGASIGNNSAAPTNGLLVTGNVGINSITPGANLDVNGSIRSVTGAAVGVGACWCTTPPKVLGYCTGALGTCTACNYNGSGC